MAEGRVVCQAMSATTWEQAAARACEAATPGWTTFRHDQGSVVLTGSGAALVCGTEGLPMLALEAKDPATAWYDPRIHASVPTKYGVAPVLPYGGVAVTPDGTRCEMSERGIYCAASSGAALSLSRDQVSLAGPTGPNRTVVRYVLTTDAAFVTPSRRIVCRIDGDGAICELTEPTFTPPPRPADCDLEWGPRIGVNRTSLGFYCHGDTMAQVAEGSTWGGLYDPRFPAQGVAASGRQGSVLGYGSTISTSRYTCSVAPAGVTCTERPTGRGFTVATGSYQVFG
jgi:hypothetical protein